ncbi:hypothetical protein JCM33374_g3901 [Metschnikowia sp. JCM 33374]|nr:hypothetical protein JCM33374_g3901 [Metschnikowia sp. JCM 33374]
MLFLIIFLQALNLVIATPPACFIRCINSISNICEKNQADIQCLCKIHEAVNQCIALHCPADHFYSARDHFSGTCSEHSFPFETYEAAIPFNESEVTGFESEEEDFGNDGSDNDYEEQHATDSFEESSAESDESGNSGDSDDSGDSAEWTEGSDWLEGSDWPEESDLDLSDLNQDVIKNYMKYFLKQKPSSRPTLTPSHEILNLESKTDVSKKANQRPFIVHGPSSYVPPNRNGGNDKDFVHKSRYQKYDVGFDRDKQDQILRRRL